MRLEVTRRLPLVERHTVSDAWAVNTYAACDIRCTYCITSAQGRSAPRSRADELASQLRHELDRIGEVDRLVVGPYCDVYPSPEVRLGITRRALEVLDERELSFRLVTKGTTVVRDADLLTRPGNLIQVSLNTLDDDAIARLEPEAPSAAARLDALHELASRGVEVLLQATPWIPEITDVSALRRRVDPDIAIQVTPLRLPAHLARATRCSGPHPGRGQRRVPAGVRADRADAAGPMVAAAAPRRQPAAHRGQPRQRDPVGLDPGTDRTRPRAPAELDEARDLIGRAAPMARC